MGRGRSGGGCRGGRCTGESGMEGRECECVWCGWWCVESMVLRMTVEVGGANVLGVAGGCRVWWVKFAEGMDGGLHKMRWICVFARAVR